MGALIGELPLMGRSTSADSGRPSPAYRRGHTRKRQINVRAARKHTAKCDLIGHRHHRFGWGIGF